MIGILNVEVVENGFIASESLRDDFVGKKWAFESAESLARFVANWGNENSKVSGAVSGVVK